MISTIFPEQTKYCEGILSFFPQVKNIVYETNLIGETYIQQLQLSFSCCFLSTFYSLQRSLNVRIFVQTFWVDLSSQMLSIFSVEFLQIYLHNSLPTTLWEVFLLPPLQRFGKHFSHFFR